MWQSAQAERVAQQDVALAALRTQLNQVEAALLSKTSQLTVEQDATASALGRAEAAETQIAQWTVEAEAQCKHVAELQVRVPPLSSLSILHPPNLLPLCPLLLIPLLPISNE